MTTQEPLPVPESDDDAWDRILNDPAHEKSLLLIQQEVQRAASAGLLQPFDPSLDFDDDGDLIQHSTD